MVFYDAECLETSGLKRTHILVYDGVVNYFCAQSYFHNSKGITPSVLFVEQILACFIIDMDLKKPDIYRCATPTTSALLYDIPRL